MRTAIWHTDGVCSPKEVLSNWHNLSTVRNGDRSIVAMSVVVAWLLVVLEPLHEREKVWSEHETIPASNNHPRLTLAGPAFSLEVIYVHVEHRSRPPSTLAHLPQSDAEARVYICEEHQLEKREWKREICLPGS